MVTQVSCGSEVTKLDGCATACLVQDLDVTPSKLPPQLIRDYEDPLEVNVQLELM